MVLTKAQSIRKSCRSILSVESYQSVVPSQKRVDLALLLIILLVALFLRIYRLDDIPPGLHYDEAANAILAADIAKGEACPLFIEAYTGKEVLFFYLAGASMRLLGTSVFSPALNFGLDRHTHCAHHLPTGQGDVRSSRSQSLALAGPLQRGAAGDFVLARHPEQVRLPGHKPTPSASLNAVVLVAGVAAGEQWLAGPERVVLWGDSVHLPGQQGFPRGFVPCLPIVVHFR